MRRKHCALAVVRRSQKKFAPPQTAFDPGVAGQPKFNQLQMVATNLQTQFGDDRCTRNFELLW